MRKSTAIIDSQTRAPKPTDLRSGLAMKRLPPSSGAARPSPLHSIAPSWPGPLQRVVRRTPDIVAGSYPPPLDTGIASLPDIGDPVPQHFVDDLCFGLAHPCHSDVEAGFPKPVIDCAFKGLESIIKRIAGQLM